MRKLIGLIIACIALTTCFFACKSETYADKLKKERKAIEKFIDDNNIKVIHEYPNGGVFAENEFFKDETTGVYIQVINPGNEERPIKGKTDIYLRYDSIYDLLTKKVEANPSWNNESPMTFRYGISNTYYNSSNIYSSSYYLLSQGCVVPLDYGLGNKAEVRLIVPFENGATAQQSAYKPLYFSRLRYTFTLDETKE